MTFKHHFAISLVAISTEGDAGARYVRGINQGAPRSMSLRGLGSF